MTTSILVTRLYVPRPRSGIIPRVHLIECLNQGLGGKLSLDAEDCDLSMFLAYLVAALQTVHPQVGEQLSGMLQSPQLPLPQTLLTSLLNALAALPG